MDSGSVKSRAIRMNLFFAAFAVAGLVGWLVGGAGGLCNSKCEC